MFERTDLAFKKNQLSAINASSRARDECNTGTLFDCQFSTSVEVEGY